MTENLYEKICHFVYFRFHFSYYSATMVPFSIHYVALKTCTMSALLISFLAQLIMYTPFLELLLSALTFISMGPNYAIS